MVRKSLSFMSEAALDESEAALDELVLAELDSVALDSLVLASGELDCVEADVVALEVLELDALELDCALFPQAVSASIAKANAQASAVTIMILERFMLLPSCRYAY